MRIVILKRAAADFIGGGGGRLSNDGGHDCHVHQIALRKTIVVGDSAVDCQHSNNDFRKWIVCRCWEKIWEKMGRELVLRMGRVVDGETLEVR